MSLIEELVSYEKEVIEKKVSKPIISLPQSFEQLEIISGMIYMTLNQLVRSVHVEIARHKNQSKRAVPVADDPTPNTRFAGRLGKNRGHGPRHNGGGGRRFSFRGGVRFRNSGRGNDGGRGKRVHN